MNGNLIKLMEVKINTYNLYDENILILKENIRYNNYILYNNKPDFILLKENKIRKGNFIVNKTN